MNHKNNNAIHIKGMFYLEDVGEVWNRHSNEPDIVP